MSILPESRHMQTKGHLLLVEDNEDFALGLLMSLRKANYGLEHVKTLADAQGRLATQTFDVILLDLTLPDASGIEVIAAIRQAHPSAALLVLTGHNDAELAVAALRMGAQDYLTKPILQQELLKNIETATQQVRSRRGIAQPNAQGQYKSPHVIGDSPAWRQALEMIHAAAASPRTTVLVTGEPGVGKEVAVQMIHNKSERANQSMVAVNVACLPVSLMESELFGHEAGAFTGARGLKRGFFEQADNSTLFLDEIGELPLELQAKLLRVLEGKPFRRLGGERDLQPNVRLISATNRRLDQLVAEGLFREDLYHRLKVLEIKLPPLRERSHDIEKLALHFLARLSAEMGHTNAYMSAEAIALLHGYNWPGNIRELRNVIERALVLSRGGLIMPHHLPHEVQTSQTHTPLPPTLAPISEPAPSTQPTPTSTQPTPTIPEPHQEDWRLDVAIHRHVKRVVSLSDGNKSLAAELLGITRQTLRKRMLPPPIIATTETKK